MRQFSRIPYVLAEYDRAVAVQQDTMLNVPADGTRQHERFDIAAYLCQLGRTHGVVHTFDVLLNYRALVKGRRDVMGRGTNNFYTPRVSLVVRPCPLEAGQKTVMNIDDAPFQRQAQDGRRNWHVTGEHDQINAKAIHQNQYLLFLLCGRVGGDGKEMKWEVIAGGQAGKVVMVGHDAGDLNGQVAAVRAEQQVVQAVALAAYQYQNPLFALGVVNLRLHVESVGHRCKRGFQFVNGCRLRQVEMHAQKKAVGLGVTKLLGVNNIAVPVKEPPRYVVHNPDAVRTGKRKNKVVHSDYGSGPRVRSQQGSNMFGQSQARGQAGRFDAQHMD